MDVNHLTDAQLAMARSAQKEGVKHTRIIMSDAPNNSISAELYPTSHSGQCSSCNSAILHTPIFIPVSYNSNRDVWVFEPLPYCSFVCAKHQIVVRGGPTKHNNCTLFTEYCARFFNHTKPVPFVDVRFYKRDKEDVSIVLHKPPHIFINTWISETDLAASDKKKQNEFDRKHALKATKEQQEAYQERLENARRNANLKNKN